MTDARHARRANHGSRGIAALFAMLLMIGTVGLLGSPAQAATAPTLTCANQITTVGQAFSYTPTFSGNPAPTISPRNGSDSVPGLTLNQTTGKISGTPAANSGGLYTIKLKADNNTAPNATCDFTIAVQQVPKIQGGANVSKTATVGQAFSYTPNISGFPTSTLTLGNNSDPLPSGLTLSSGAVTGIVGTPAAGTGGTYDIRIKATNLAGTDAQNIALTVNEAPILTGGATKTCKAGDSCSYTPTFAPGYPPASVTLTSGVLPGGLTLDATTGAITGTPTPGLHGDFPITLTASNGVAPDATLDVTFTITKDDIEGLDPTITGIAQVGQTLTANTGTVVPSAGTTFTYQWNANGNPIQDATDPTYKLKKAQAGKTITVTITASNPGYNPQTATSDPTVPVHQKVKNPTLSISDDTVQRGDTVTLFGQGFTPGTTYTVRYNASIFGTGGSYVTSVTADQYGELSVPITIPNGSPSGPVGISVTGPGLTLSYTTVIVENG